MCDRVDHLHCLTLLGTKHLGSLIKASNYYVSKISETVDRVVKACVPCAMINTGHSKFPSGKRLRGCRPGDHWEGDFTEVKPAR